MPHRSGRDEQSPDAASITPTSTSPAIHHLVMIAPAPLRISATPPRSRRRRSWFIAGLLALAPLPAAAQDAGCDADSFPPEAKLSQAVVRSGTARIHFVRSGDGCPGAASCRERAYLVPGNRVIVSRRQDDFACALHIGPKGRSRTGWLPQGALAVLKDKGPPRWTGRWNAGSEQQITIAPDPVTGGLKMDGIASYGVQDPERVKRGAIHMGSFAAELSADASLRPLLRFTAADEATLAYDQGHRVDCRLRMRAIAGSLIVRDNGNCGGFNVSFSGIYRRAN